MQEPVIDTKSKYHKPETDNRPQYISRVISGNQHELDENLHDEREVGFFFEKRAVIAN